jgi:hypothetical protein
MMKAARMDKAYLFFAAIIAIVSLACNLSGGAAPTQPALTAEQVQAEPTSTLAATAAPEATATPVPTEAPPPTETPIPTDTPVASPPGMSRSNPFPATELVSAPNWDLQVLEIKRGEEAWKEIQAAYDYNVEAAEGMEYLLVKLHVKSTYADSEEHNINYCDFNATGERLIQYTCGSAPVIGPEPQLDATLFTGGEADGWAQFMVAQGEGDMILVFDEAMNFEENSERFIALDEGASISISPDLEAIKPNDLGKERSNPAPINEKVITEDWEVTVLEVVRGQEAWNILKEANSYNEPPKDGLEYIVVRTQVRFIGTEEKPQLIYGNGGFYTTTGSANVVYDDTTFVIPPNPVLTCMAYPGGECEGWSVLEAGVGETEVVLIFEPILDFSGLNKRYLSLEE